MSIYQCLWPNKNSTANTLYRRLINSRLASQTKQSDLCLVGNVRRAEFRPRKMSQSAAPKSYIWQDFFRTQMMNKLKSNWWAPVLPFLMLLTMAFSMGGPSLFDFKVEGLEGDELDLSQFKGKKVLVVNTASKCGYTPQYEGLQKLYEAQQGKLIIIGFPANNFGAQEPGTNAEIETFCQQNYGVTFPMAAKVSVKGADIHPLFKWILEQENPDYSGDIKWNFEKFLFDEEGHLIRRFGTKVTPEVVGEAI